VDHRETVEAVRDGHAWTEGVERFAVIRRTESLRVSAPEVEGEKTLQFRPG